jgi:regulator of protease activity HflC (stomatin/prohibitin superfamily)
MNLVRNVNYNSNQSEENLEYSRDEPEKSTVSSSGRPLMTYVKNIFMILLFGIFIFNAYYTNDASQRAVESRLGKFIRITGPGVHFKLPFIESYKQYNIAIQAIAPKEVSTASLDNYALNANIALLYRLPEEQVEYIHRNIPEFKELLDNLVKKMFKDEIGKINMIDVPSKRDELGKYIIKNLKKTIQQMNFNIELYDFSLPYYDWSETFIDDIQKLEAVKSKTRTAKSDCHRAIVAAKTVKIETNSKIHRVLADAEIQTIKSQDIEMEIQKIAAHVDAMITKIMAESEADAITIKGRAQADALKAQADALKADSKLVELEKIKRWDGQLPDCHNIQGIFPFISKTSANTLPTILLPQSRDEP